MLAPTRPIRRLLFAAVTLATLAPSGAVAAVEPDTEAKVSVGSPADRTPQNHQDEPAVAVDAHAPNVLAAGANDTIDFAPCPETLATQQGVCLVRFSGGISGVYFSFDSGRHWTQPTYTGTTGYDCADGDSCSPHFGPIHTLPWYAEAGLVTWGDPAVAFGPIPVNGKFSWANGSRLYYGTLVVEAQGMTFPNTGDEFKGFLGIAVSRLDNATPERITQKSSWARPVIVSSRNNPTSFSDKDQIWADNAESSPYFGNVYSCWAQDHVVGAFLSPVNVAVSRDGGDTWTVKQASPADLGQRLGCALRTDSHGVVYLIYSQLKTFTLPFLGAHVLQKSYDGGRTWTPPQDILPTNAGCYERDQIPFNCVVDGFAGARLFGALPSFDIANGAPTGADATNELVVAWGDGGDGINGLRALVSWSTDAGASWQEPIIASVGDERPMYAAPAIAPDGKRIYLVYEALLAPWRGADMFAPRPYHGVFRTAPVGPDGSPGAWSTVIEGATGDVRGSYPGHDIYQERVGDYVYAAATRDYGVGLWTDVRDAPVCDAVQQYRQDSYNAGQRALPAPWPLAACDAHWGNTDIWAATTG
jgi:hypothetical protein